MVSLQNTNNVTSIGQGSFWGTSNLNDYLDFSGCTKIENVSSYSQTNGTFARSGIAGIDLSGIQQMTNERNWDWPNNGMFSNCKSLKTVTMPSSTPYRIQHCQFIFCTNLENINLNSCTSIGHQAFRECSYLADISSMENVTSIGYCAFGRCSNLKIDLYLPSLTNLDYTRAQYTLSSYVGTFAYSGIKSIQSLGSITEIPNENIGSDWYNAGVFSNCTNLESAVLPASLRKIGRHAFYGCSKLSSVNFSNAPISKICIASFRGCNNMSNLENFNKESLLVIEHSAFAYAGIEDIDFPNIQSIGVDGTSGGYSGAFFSSKLKKITNLGVIRYIPNGGSLWDTSRPYSVGVFQSCTQLTEATLPSTLLHIGNGAFYKCSILSQLILKATTPPTIGTDAFTGCSSLSSIKVPAGCADVYKTSSAWSKYSSIISESE